MLRTFDLLTHPIAADEPFETYTNLPWKNARDLKIQIADEVRHLFTGVTGKLEHGRFAVTGKRNDAEPTIMARFAAVVSCETDETDEAPAIEPTWPELVTRISPPPEPLPSVAAAAVPSRDGADRRQ